MTRLRDIMTTHVISISHDMSIRDAMAVLSSRHISGAPVVDGGRVVGVLSTSDLLAWMAEQPHTPDQVPLVSEAADQTLLDELEEVADDEPPASFFVDMYADAGVDALLRMAETRGPDWNALDQHTVADVMTRAPLIQVSSDTTLPAAADFMRSREVHRLLVMDNGRLVGIVTATDIADAVADHKLRERTFVFGRESHFTGEARSLRRSPTLGERFPKP